ncbi:MULTISPECIES: MalY/PatB family protein [Actinomyces]|nr:aminotransferase class I/II-fold pyridoxal phosphate-dependent enzyme [Actinomyces sp. 2119]
MSGMSEPASVPAPGSATSLTRSFDALTPEVMRERGSLKWTYYPGDIIGAWVAEMDLGTAPAVAAVIQRCAQEGTIGYLPPETAQAACQEVARYHREAFGWDVPAEEVSLLPDVLSALNAVIAFHTREGSPVIVPTPAYMPFLSIPGHHGRDCLQVPALERRNHDGSPRWELDLDGIEAAMRQGAGLLVLCNPWNPVGRVLSAEELSAVAFLSSRYGVPVFADEVHAPLVLDPSLTHIPYGSLPDTDPALTYTATAVSKGWNIPALKCAQLIASGQARARWEADPRSAGLSHSASLLGAQAVLAALRDGQDWLAQVRRYIRTNAELVRQGLDTADGLEVTLPEGTYLAWLDCRGLGTDNPARFFRRRAGVAMNEGVTFGDAWDGFCRLNLATGRAIEAETVRRIVTAARQRPVSA